MGNHVVDTNVWLAASTADPNSTFCGTDQLSPDELLAVLDWVTAFRADASRCLVLDTDSVIRKEYYRKLGTGDLGMLILIEKLQTALYHEIQFDAHGHAVLPQPLLSIIDDREDRKFAAVALADPAHPSIVNACDSDWKRYETALAAHGIQVINLI